MNNILRTAEMDKLSPELILLVFQALPEVGSACQLSLVDKRLQDVWVKQRGYILYEIASNSILAFGHAILAVRSTKAMVILASYMRSLTSSR